MTHWSGQVELGKDLNILHVEAHGIEWLLCIFDGIAMTNLAIFNYLKQNLRLFLV